MITTELLTDKSRILRYLETDRGYAAYLIGDLEPGMFEQCTWSGATCAGQLQALALHFRGLSLPALVLMGDTEGLRAILRDALCPEHAYLTCRPAQLAMTTEFYAWEEQVLMWRMRLAPARFRPVGGDCIRLTPADAESLASLYALGGGPAFAPAQMAQGVFYGVFVDGRLVAAAGTHLVSLTYGVAAVGNVFAHPNHRRQGYGTAVTSAVVADLVECGIGEVVLNVSQANEAAIRVYEWLGFERYCPFYEGPVTARP
jgi:ribosomal protein S18 acetylase RimI-like enzyme